MKVLVTGANGFIGKNFVCQLKDRTCFKILQCGRETTVEELRQGILEADFICHLAGVNRPEDTAEFARVNTGLTQTLCQIVQESGRQVPIIFTSSVHVERNNHYGQSKLAAEQVLLQHSKNACTPIYIFRLPHVIGKWCRPNYNSVVATFCHNIARDLPVRIDDPAYSLKLIYIDDLVSNFIEIIMGKRAYDTYCEAGPLYSISVGKLAEQLRLFRASQNSLISEQVGNGLTRVLYATYMSYLPSENFAYEVPKYHDARGIFVEMLKTKDSGQFSFFTIYPGVTRGGHYHHSKSEKFLVINGTAKFRFRHILTQELHEIVSTGDNPRIVESVPGWAHDITNVSGEEMVVMLWANELFDREHPDTYACPV